MKYLYINVSNDRLIELWLRGIFPNDLMKEYIQPEQSGLRDHVKEIPPSPVSGIGMEIQKIIGL